MFALRNLEKEKPKTQKQGFTLTLDEKKQIELAAKHKGLTTSEFCREAVLHYYFKTMSVERG